MIYVLRNGSFVEKPAPRPALDTSFPTPFVSRMEPYESPITGEQITSWGARERDLKDSNSVDPRDLPRQPFEDRKNRYG